MPRDMIILAIGAALGVMIYGFIMWLTNRTIEASHELRHEDELSFSHLRIRRRLGRGSFGAVHEGVLNQTLVAVKILTNITMTREAFLMEAKMMKGLNHENIVKYIGTAFSPRGDIHIVMELMPNGSLLDLLKDEKCDLDLRDLLKISLSCANGMAFLESKKLIHRDLAARNVLMGENLIAKIADFGLARMPEGSIYRANPDGLYPIMWTAPEAIEFKTFSTRSDVWSFGVVLYEIFSKGAVPFPGFRHEDVLPWLKNGNRLPCPQTCPWNVYNIMTDCWKEDPKERPRFFDLVDELEGLYI